MSLRKLPRGYALILGFATFVTCIIPACFVGSAFLSNPRNGTDDRIRIPTISVPVQNNVPSNTVDGRNTPIPLDSPRTVVLTIAFGFIVALTVVSIYAGSMINDTYIRLVQVKNCRGIKGIEVARLLLLQLEVTDVKIALVRGHLTDFYNPQHKILALSNDVANTSSIVSLAIVAHEIGHLEEHLDRSIWTKIRNFIAPIIRFIPLLGIGVFGLIASITPDGFLALIIASIVCILLPVLTVPSEKDASKRAIRLLERNDLIGNAEERDAVQDMLNAAAWTYIAASFEFVSALFGFNRLQKRLTLPLK